MSTGGNIFRPRNTNGLDTGGELCISLCSISWRLTAARRVVGPREREEQVLRRGESRKKKRKETTKLERGGGKCEGLKVVQEVER